MCYPPDIFLKIIAGKSVLKYHKTEAMIQGKREEHWNYLP